MVLNLYTEKALNPNTESTTVWLNPAHHLDMLPSHVVLFLPVCHETRLLSSSPCSWGRGEIFSPKQLVCLWYNDGLWERFLSWRQASKDTLNYDINFRMFCNWQWEVLKAAEQLCPGWFSSTFNAKSSSPSAGKTVKAQALWCWDSEGEGKIPERGRGWEMGKELSTGNCFKLGPHNSNSV